MLDYVCKMYIGILDKNRTKKSGLKNELIERCVEGELYGALPPCPLCPSKHLYYAWGLYRCLGFFDIDKQKHLSCGFMSPSVQKLAWKS